MLIRLVGHFRNNPKSIDKLIAIKGLPEDWIFRELPNGEGKTLVSPWIADIDKNIPHDIRSACEPVYLTFKYPPIEKGAKEVLEKRQVLGIKLDYMTEPGRELWDKIERYLEGTVPRDMQVPKPVLCSRDERSPFETHAAKRNSTGSLELIPSPIPEIDLTPYTIKKVEYVEPPPVLVEKEPEGPTRMAKEFKCDECEKEFAFEKVLKRHKRQNHKKEKVEA